MHPVTVRIHVDRAAAIRAGKSRWGDAIVEVNPGDLSPEDRETLARLPATPDGQHLDLTYGKGIGLAHEAAGATVPEVLTLLAEWRRTEAEFQATEAERERQAAERCEKTTAEWLARSDDDLIVKRWDGVCTQWGIPQPYDLDTRDPRVAERLPRLQAIADERRRADTERAEVLRRKREEREQAEERTRQEQLAEWVETLCSDVQRRRRDAGLMSDEEVLAVAMEAVFKPLAGFERYRGITKEEVVEAANSMAGEVDVYSRKAEALTDAEFERLEAVRAAMRAAGHEAVKVEAREHLGEHDDEVMIRRVGVLVAVTVGGWKLRREYAAEAEERDGRAEAA